MVDVGELTLFENGDYCVNDELPIAPKQLMQFTGFKDKNGKEIYEGDIVRHIGRTDEVFFETTMGCFVVYNDVSGTREIGYLTAKKASMCEVIGNIHANPGLLSGSRNPGGDQLTNETKEHQN